VIIQSTLLTADRYISFAKLKRTAQIIMKVIQSGRQIDSKFQTPANYFSAYVYASRFNLGVHVLRAI